MARLRGALKAGNTIVNACAWAGISEPTFYRWKKEAKTAPEGSVAWNFWRAVKKALAIAEDKLVRIIEKAGEEDWGAAAWMLERRNPQQWGRMTWKKPKPKAPSTQLRPKPCMALPSNVQNLRK